MGRSMIDTALGIGGLAFAGWVVLVGILALQERRLIFFQRAVTSRSRPTTAYELTSFE